MTRQKTTFKNKILLIRICLTIAILACFLPIFFVLGGSNLILGKIGNVKHFSSLGFEVHFIDVGQGDSAFVRFPDNSNMLIDAGPPGSSDALVSYLDDLFRQEGIHQIDRFLLTHQDNDHIGGASAVFEAFKVCSVYRPKVYCTYEVENLLNDFDYNSVTSPYYNGCIMSAYNEPDCRMIFSTCGLEWSGEDYSVKFLSPSLDKYPSTNHNAYSPIVKITYKQRSFLFTGDAEKIAENEVIQNFPDQLDADVLKVGHHGSSTSSSAKFLQLVSPEIAVISVGYGNSYGHPAADTIERLNDCDCQIFQTSIEGSIVLAVDQTNTICKGGQNNKVSVALTVSIVVSCFGILIVWGVKIKNQQNSTKKSQTKKIKRIKNKKI